MESRFKEPKDRRQISEVVIMKNMGNQLFIENMNSFTNKSDEQKKLDENIRANEIKSYIEKKRKETYEKKKNIFLEKQKFAKEKEMKLAELQKNCRKLVNASITKKEKNMNTFKTEKRTEYKTETPQIHNSINLVEKSENLEIWDMEKRVATLQKQLEARRIEFLRLIEEYEKLRLESFKEEEQKLLQHIELYDKLIEKSKKNLILEITEKNLQTERSSYSNIQYTTKYNCNTILEKMSENLSPSDKTIWAEEKKYFCQIKTKELSTIEIKALNDANDIPTEINNIHLNDCSQSFIEETNFNTLNGDAVDPYAISLNDFSVQSLKIPKDYTNHVEQELCSKSKPDNGKLSNTSSSRNIIQREIVVDLNENDDNVYDKNGNFYINPLGISSNEIETDNDYTIDFIPDENASQSQRSCALYKYDYLIKLQFNIQNYEDEIREDVNLKNKLIIERCSGNGSVVHNEKKSSDKVYYLTNNIVDCRLEDPKQIYKSNSIKILVCSNKIHLNGFTEYIPIFMTIKREGKHRRRDIPLKQEQTVPNVISNSNLNQTVQNILPEMKLNESQVKKIKPTWYD